ncbi:MAG: hypothetical protein HQM10_10365 [Candidatus Riflebacteria bacterium]|nr:hypothetical protein [Candidatus Riflebacteria bacterium]
MPITPVEAKVTFLAKPEASRLREQEKLHEQGDAAQLVQNKDKIQEKVETVQQSQNTEGKVIKKDDEEKEKGELKKKKQNAQNKEEEAKEDAPPELPDPEKKRGFKIDIKA